ncbi:hypothetical protein Y032_0019g3803 [Ancylostoma ceylanicum]|uniref:Uncharacterized protein n=1 Tax=Ancylostoma ceylanicum TaxID=53326 RepID=A0A016V309_9BILA|nr:hypothetical protein Y032_0019g3803 [Ancylostoma ceylanicum]
MDILLIPEPKIFVKLCEWEDGYHPQVRGILGVGHILLESSVQIHIEFFTAQIIEECHQQRGRLVVNGGGGDVGFVLHCGFGQL